MGSLNPVALRTIRELLGIKKVEMARRLAINHGVYGRFEAGTRNPSPETITRIALQLGVEPGAITCPHRTEREQHGHLSAAS
ncbi:MAG TPA: helix-turn-helix transcriptional regulator [Micromonosporaceae bacterium]|nr:helix-turn-helix transcriptional regulator [Micromonosporaceae bacterium]